MQKINKLYHFEKFWDMYTRQNRASSAWDESRTDMDIFIKRTLNRWFSGKFFEVKLEIHIKNDNWFIDKKPTQYQVYTQYVYITNIQFSFAPYGDLITIHFLQPHSIRIEKVCWGYTDFVKISVIENEADFWILNKFYPVRLVDYPTTP